MSLPRYLLAPLYFVLLKQLSPIRSSTLPQLSTLVLLVQPLDHFSIINGFYRLASPQGYVLATTDDYFWNLDLSTNWRISIVSNSRSPSSRLTKLYIPDYYAKTSAIRWWALNMELIISTFIFRSSPILLTTVMGWVGPDPRATHRALYFALGCHSSYFSHLGRAFIPAAEAIFARLHDFFLDGAWFTDLIPLQPRPSPPALSTESSLPTVQTAQYLPMTSAVTGSCPYNQAQRIPMAFRMARRRIFNIPVFETHLVLPNPLSLSFLASFTTLRRFTLRHIYIIDCTLTLSILFHQVYLPRLLLDPSRLRYFSCLASSRIVHYNLCPWTLTYAVPPSVTTPSSVCRQRPFRTSPRDVLTPHCPASSRTVHSNPIPRTHYSAVLSSHTTSSDVCCQRLVRTLTSLVLLPSSLMPVSRLLYFPPGPRSRPVVPPPSPLLPVSRLQYSTPGPRLLFPPVKHSLMQPNYNGHVFHLSHTLSCVVLSRSARLTHSATFHSLSRPDYVCALRFLAFLTTYSSVSQPFAVLFFLTLCAYPFAMLLSLAMLLSHSCNTPLVIPLMEYFYYHPP